MMEKMRNRKKKKGFTLIELIVVIAILGILAAIAIPRFSDTRTNAQANADLATVRTVNSAWQIYLAEGGTESTPPAGKTWPESYLAGATGTNTTSVVIDGYTVTRAANAAVWVGSER